MNKIQTIFRRDGANRSKVVFGDVELGCEGILEEGVPTRKYDGTCVMFDGVSWWARREVRKGKSVPRGFIDADGVNVFTDRRMGWVPMASAPIRRVFRLAYHASDSRFTIGTYELCGPRVATRGGKNPEGLTEHVLVRHGVDPLGPAGTAAIDLIRLCRENGWEGVVWWHPDGRRAKLKVRDCEGVT